MNNTPNNQWIDNNISENTHKTDYNQTCIKRSSLGQSKSGLLRQVTS